MNNIEAQTLIDMLEKDIIPAGIKYETAILSEYSLKDKFGITSTYEKEAITKISSLVDSIYNSLKELKKDINETPEFKTSLERGLYYRETVLTKMESTRKLVDELEVNVSKEYWPYPSYGDLLFGVK